MPGKEPQRSCIACRAVQDKRELLRFVLSPERELVPDLLAKLPGRGAYTCMKSACIMLAIKNRQFNRAFKCEVNIPETAQLIDQLIARMKERIGSLISMACKAGKVVSGSDMVIESIGRKKSGLLLIASDISPEIGKKILENAKRNDVPHESIFDKETLGALIGKGLRSVVLVETSGLSGMIRGEVSRYRNFLEGGMEAR
jgi:predicted RNA-binding protein YlxR (DUF448 family)/ribosomal protein L30E